MAEVLLAFADDQRELVSAQDAEGSSSLHHAARKGHNEIVALLVQVLAFLIAVLIAVLIVFSLPSRCLLAAFLGTLWVP